MATSTKPVGDSGSFHEEFFPIGNSRKFLLLRRLHCALKGNSNLSDRSAVVDGMRNIFMQFFFILS